METGVRLWPHKRPQRGILNAGSVRYERSIAAVAGLTAPPRMPAIEWLVQRVKLFAQLRRLGPAWGEVREELNEVNRTLS